MAADLDLLVPAFRENVDIVLLIRHICIDGLARSLDRLVV